MKKTFNRFELTVILIISMIQFVNILDFMMIMPLGPDFAGHLNVPGDKLGILGASYTLAAAFSGLCGSFFLDKFERKFPLLICLGGLSVATVLGGFAYDFQSLIITRLLAGFFGGPATSIAFSIIADVISIDKRGRAMGMVMGAFSIASVLGVPFGLELSHRGGWQLPFFVVGGLAMAIAIASLITLPRTKPQTSLRAPQSGARQSSFSILTPGYLPMMATIGLSMFGGFIIIPNISAYLQYNLDFPRDKLGTLYSIGGVLSFFSMRMAGRFVDKFGSTLVIILASLIVIPVMFFGFINYQAWIPISVTFALFMIGLSTRNVAVSSLGTKVPLDNDRARYMSLQSCIQHLMSACGAYLSTKLLTENPDKSLNGIPLIACVMVGTIILLPIFSRLVEIRIKRRTA